jgi:hypothetical protein
MLRGGILGEEVRVNEIKIGTLELGLDATR